MDKLTNQALATDIRSLDRLRQMSVSTDPNTSSADAQHQALVEAAKQFESIFTQMWMKSMREANNALVDEDNPFNSRDTQFYQGMLDDQIAANVATSGNGSLANLIVKQLSPQHQSSLTNNKTAVMDRFAMPQANNSSNVPAGVLAAERFIANKPNMASSLRRTTQAATNQQNSDTDTQQHQFVRQLMPAAKMVASKMGLSPVALIAQAALETGWGKHMMQSGNGSSSNNLFGIKSGRSWQGDKTSANSLEYENGHAVMKRSSFRSYTSVVQSMQDYANLITSSDRYQKAKAVAHDPDAYFEELQAAGYATDPQYADKLKRVLRSDALKAIWPSTAV